jgi:hypothetical protein
MEGKSAQAGAKRSRRAARPPQPQHVTLGRQSLIAGHFLSFPSRDPCADLGARGCVYLLGKCAAGVGKSSRSLMADRG